MAVDSPAPAPVAPVPEAPAPTAAGGDDPNDSGDGSDGDDSDGEEDNDSQGDNDNSEVNGAATKRELCCVRTSDEETGHFPMLLKDVLRELGNNVAPYYHTRRYIDPVLGEHYLTRVHVRVADGFRGRLTVSAHDSDGPLPTYYDSVSSAARRALWSLYHTNREDL